MPHTTVEGPGISLEWTWFLWGATTLGFVFLSRTLVHHYRLR